MLWDGFREINLITPRSKAIARALPRSVTKQHRLVGTHPPSTAVNDQAAAKRGVTLGLQFQGKN